MFINCITLVRRHQKGPNIKILSTPRCVSIAQTIHRTGHLASGVTMTTSTILLLLHILSNKLLNATK